MEASPVFVEVCEELERRTFLDRLEARGTVRLSLREAGLDAGSVNQTQMLVLLRRVLPGELEARGVENTTALCEELAEFLTDRSYDSVTDRVGNAASTLDRFGT